MMMEILAMDISGLYQEVILDHAKSPRNFGVLEQYTCTAEGNNPMCGDQLTVYVDIKDGVVSDVSYRARGCAISIASASIMSSMIKGRTLEEVNILFDKFHKLCTGQEVEDDDDIERLRVNCVGLYFSIDYITFAKVKVSTTNVRSN